MQKSFRSLLSLSWQSLAYGIGFFGRQLIVLISLPIITGLVDQAEYGVISIITSFYLMINTLTNVGIPSATFRLYNDDISQEEKGTILGTSLGIFFLLAFALAVLMSVFSGTIAEVLLGSTVYWKSILIVSALLVVETLNYYGSILLRLQTRPLALSVQTLVTVVSQLGSAVILIKAYDYGVDGYWTGFLIGAVVGLAVMIWLNREVIQIQFSSGTARELLRYGIPLIPVTLAISVMQLTDRYFLRTFLGLDVVAVYAVGFRVGSIVNLVLAPFQYAWPNFAFSIIQDEDARNIYKHVSTFVLFGTGLVSLGIFLFRGELVSILSPENYHSAASVVAWIAAAMVLNGLHPIFSLGPKIRKDTRPLAWISILTMAVNIALLLVFIPIQGLVGAGIATFLSFLFFAMGNYYLTNRSYHLPLDWKRLGFIILGVIGLSWVGDVLSGRVSGAALLLIRGVLLICYPLILAVLGIIPLKQIATQCKEFLTGLSSRKDA